MKKHNISLDLLKTLTILLIINSHADVLYPPKIQFLATGGAIGNALFFLISGYLFSAKENIKRDVWKRYIRLYVPAYIMIIITAFFGGFYVDDVIDAVRVFVWPTQFWFVGVIFVYSILLYGLIKKNIDKKKVFFIFSMLIIIVDVVLYIFCIPDKNVWIVEDAYLLFIPFRSIYGIFTFVLGYYLKVNKNKMESVNEKLVVTLAVITFIGFYGFKFLLNKCVVPMTMQILSQPLTVICALCIFLSFVKIDINPKLEGTIIGCLIEKLSTLSLESFLVQFLIITGISTLNIIFPVNIFICVLMTVLSAFILHLIDTWILNKVMESLVQKE